MSKAPHPTGNDTPETASAAPQAAQASHFSRGLRDTVEAIAIAFALAFLFKTFQAEAFMIPTGSMAPTLMGRHKDVECPECGFRYTASGSEEADRNGNELRTPSGEIDSRYQVVECTCPNCRYPMSVDPELQDPADGGPHPSYSGDRIWVSKVPYQFAEPRRWDVIVFRFPLEAETYFIKRLVGLPGETVRIQHGDIFVRADGSEVFELARKPPEKILAMSQVVHDADHVSAALVEAGWPARWRTWSSEPGPSDWRMSEDRRSFSIDGAAEGESWIRYEHRVPPDRFWREMDDSKLRIDEWSRPQLITDFYAFNTRVLRKDERFGMLPSALGLHWVGDLIVECEVDVQSVQGTLLLDLVKGGRHFRCTIDAATGQATLSIDGQPDWRPTAKTALVGPGSYRVRLANVDRQVVLWIDDDVVDFDRPTTYPALDNDRPQSNQRDAGDLAPVGIGARGLKAEVRDLRVLRDIYYIADGNLDTTAPISDFSDRTSFVPILRTDQLIDFLSTPERWTTRGGRSAFDDRQSTTFRLEPDQFFVLGDNSPASADARFWRGEHYVDRSLLVGKALLIFWPRAIEVRVPMTEVSLPIIPNVSNMGFIR